MSANIARLLRVVAFSIVATCFSCGCHIYPDPPQQRTVNELYFEAVAASANNAERALGLHMPAGPANQRPPDRLIPLPREAGPGQPLPAPPESTRDHVPLRIDAAGWRSVQRTAAENVSSALVNAGGSLLVTEVFEDTDVRQAIQSMASQAGVSVIMDEQVGGVVTALIEDEPFDTALRKVLLPAGLVSRRLSEREYLVGVADPSSPLFSRIAERYEFSPIHLSPEELASLIPERERIFLQVIEKRNRIIVEAPVEIAEPIMERLQSSDRAIPQVELEAIVCVVAPDSGFRSGMDWGHAVTLNGVEALRLGMSGLGFSGVASGVGVTNAFTDFATTSSFINLLAQEGYLSIRAAPRVTARDGEQAKISITRESYFSTQPQTADSFFRQEIEQVSAGIELDITPVIRGDNVTVKIEKAEVSEDIRSSAINSEINENPFPLINRRNVSTTVSVKDGQTVVIGGLVQRQIINRVAKVPVLGSVPVLGRLFQTVVQSEQDAEVVIFISPRIVQPAPACPPEYVVTP